MTKSQQAWIAKNKGLATAGMPGIPIDTSPRKFFAISQDQLRAFDYGGSGGRLVKSREEAIEFAEKQLASNGAKGCST